MNTDFRSSRRRVLRDTALGFGALALTDLLHADDAPAAAKTHFAPRAKRVIFLFMKGGPSHLDTFEPKPLLDRDDGKPYPGPRPRVVFAKPETCSSRRGSSRSTARAAAR